MILLTTLGTASKLCFKGIELAVMRDEDPPSRLLAQQITPFELSKIVDLTNCCKATSGDSHVRLILLPASQQPKNIMGNENKSIKEKH
jgi:hypothetical protein